MNATIVKIVDLLFEDVEPSEETQSLHDEILQNCQERYQDLRNAGISEDDAIHAVVESLSGMAEMLSAYPRRQAGAAQAPQPEARQADAQTFDRPFTLDPAEHPVRVIRLEKMGGADVRVFPGDGSLLRLECDQEDAALTVRLENGELLISPARAEKAKAPSFSLEEGFDLAAVSGALARWCRAIGQSLSGYCVSLFVPRSLCPSLFVSTASGDVTIENLSLDALQVTTASGDMSIRRLSAAQSLLATSASGDIGIADASAQLLQVSTASGDVNVCSCAAAGEARLKTTSGDIHFDGECDRLEANAISGDLRFSCIAGALLFKTVSGDASAWLRRADACRIEGASTSGDVSLRLPEGAQAEISCVSRIGDIHNHFSSVPGAPIRVSLATTTGDIEVK